MPKHRVHCTSPSAAATSSYSPRGQACEGHGLWRDRSRRQRTSPAPRGRPRARGRLALDAPNGAEASVGSRATPSSADDVARAVEGAEIVYYLVHSLGRRDFERQDQVAAENVAAACEHACVKQIVYLGGLGDDDPTASPHLRSRRETGERLSAGAVPVTTLRAAMIVGRAAPPSRRSSPSSTVFRR